MKPAISVHNISKQYRLGLAPSKDNNLTENMRLMARNAWDKVRRLATPKRAIRQEESFWALKDVSFDVMPGEVVGIIGRNGAGKSTLLKVLSHIVEPTAGYADIRGRMGSLLEVGTGFHPELTGRENIYLNGAILGMKREEINRKFDEIVAFAEVEKFLDTPVKRYSSGMYVRLAFSVAAHLEPEILIVDEVLAVGDQVFQKKCIGKMSEVRQSGRAILFVSHNMAAVQQLTSRCILMSRGKVAADGSPSDVIDRYHDIAYDMAERRYEVADAPRRFAHLSRAVEFLWLELADCPLRIIAADGELALKIGVHAKRSVPTLRISITIFRLDGTPVGSCFGADVPGLTAGEDATFRFALLDHRLAPGQYCCGLATGTGDNSSGNLDFDVIYDVVHFEVMSPEGEENTRASWNSGWGSIRLPSPHTTRLV